MKTASINTIGTAAPLFATDINNSWNRVSVSNVGNHAPPVVIRLSMVSINSIRKQGSARDMEVLQQLEFDLCTFNGQPSGRNNS